MLLLTHKPTRASTIDLCRMCWSRRSPPLVHTMAVLLAALWMALATCTAAQGMNSAYPGLSHAGVDASGAAQLASDGIYIVTLADHPAALYQGDISGYPATKPLHGRRLRHDHEHVVKYKGEVKRPALISAVGAAADPLSCTLTLCSEVRACTHTHAHMHHACVHATICVSACTHRCAPPLPQACCPPSTSAH